MLVIGRSYWVEPIQGEDVKKEAGTKFAEETTERPSVTGEVGAGAGAENEREAEAELGAEAETEAGAESEAEAEAEAEVEEEAGTKLMA